MKQILKDTIMTWIVVILILASAYAVVGVPCLFLVFAGIGGWQLIVCGLWFTFWVSLAVTVAIRT